MTQEIKVLLCMVVFAEIMYCETLVAPPSFSLIANRDACMQRGVEDMEERVD